MAIRSLFPTARPAFDINFAKIKRLDPRISFIRNSIGTYVGSDGLIKYAGRGAARFDHNPVTGESLGLLVEASGVNVWKYSDRWGQPDPATPSGVITDGKYDATGVIYNAGIAPDGTNTAIQVGPATSTATMYGFTEPATICTFSTFIKQLESTSVTITSHTQLNFNVTFNFTTETLTVGFFPSYVTGSAGFQKYPNGWYRIWFSYDRSLQSNGTLWPKVIGSATNNALLWGAQKEAGSFPTSYIPTESSSVTRAADVVSLTNTNVYDTDSFTILNQPFGAAAGASSLSIIGCGQTPVKRITVYDQELSQKQINASVGKADEFWRWRILGSSFALPGFTTNGQVTVDWGDGTIETLNTSEHIFSDGGGYHDVGFRLDSGTYFRPYVGNNASIDTKIVAVGPAPESMRLHAENAFDGCTNLKTLDATINATGSTTLKEAWRNCSGLLGFPLIDTSSAASFFRAWQNCSSLTSFPLIDTSSGTSFSTAWYGCSSLASFPLINTSSGTNFGQAWRLCTSLTDFPANFFDSWTGTPANNCFVNAWDGCTSLTATSVENILNSIDTSGQSAPASGVDITIDYDAGSGTPSVATAITNLKARGWTITLNGVAQ